MTLFAHVSDNLRVAWGDVSPGTGLVSVGYTFEGETAHSATAPWRGRSALDVVELMNMGWNYRREHLRLSQRSHYVVTDGGDQPNVIQPKGPVSGHYSVKPISRISRRCGTSVTRWPRAPRS